MINLIEQKKPDSCVYTLNELYNDGKVYIMDNHMAASWCWSQKLDYAQKYNLFHIDKHYDLLNGQVDFWVSQLKKRKFVLHESTISEFLNVEHDKISVSNNQQIFRFDNYITIFNKLYPDVLNKIKFATHNDGTVPNDWVFYEAQIYDLPTNLEFWLTQYPEKWIVNIDIDYFFNFNSDEEYFQILTDEYVVKISEQLLKAWDNIEVLTIALSPTFCGGMEKSKRVAEIICKTLNVHSPKE